MRSFIGYYRDCDLLTMTGTFFALLGCLLAIDGYFLAPIFCLVLSGICDGFDGKLARRKKYPEEQSVYGVQLDSLSDLISFGVFPLVLTSSVLNSLDLSNNIMIIAWISLLFYSLCGMIRLAYFNTLDICNKSESGIFIGVPITTISILYPLCYLICYFLKFKYFEYIVPVFFILVGLSFIYGIKIKKLNDKQKIILAVIGFLAIIGVVAFYLIK